MESTSWIAVLIPVIYSITTLYKHTQRLTCGEYLLRCGINTSIILISYYNPTLQYKQSLPGNTRFPRIRATVYTISPGGTPTVRASAQPPTAQLPQGLGSPPNSPLRLRETPYTTLLVFPVLSSFSYSKWYSALISAKSCCNRATVSIKMFSGDHATFRRSELTSLNRASMKIWGATRVPLGGNRDSGARRPPCPLTSFLGGVTTSASCMFCLSSGNRGVGAPQSSMFRSTIPPVASASKTLVSSGTTGGRLPDSTSAEPYWEAPS